MEILWKLINNNTRLPITGGAASTALKIRRGADGFLLDWGDLTFKSSGWTALNTPLVEVDAVNLPGMYIKNVTITTWIDGCYQCDLTYSGIPAQYAQGETYIMNGMPVDEAYIAPDNVLLATIDDKIDRVDENVNDLEVALALLMMTV